MLILKGIIIGIGKIIPGVSGSMLAISMGIYSKLIYCINNLFKLSKDDIIFLLKIFWGVLISILFFSRLILVFINKFYLITVIFFIGLIIGSIDDIKKNVLNKNYYVLIISFTIVLFLGLINISNEINIDNPLLNAIYFMFIGLIEAFTTIVPGISGTATLMMLGAYNRVIEMYSNIININYLNLTIPFSIGLIIGIFITSKLINYLFKNYKSETYSAILGFCYSTIILMFIKVLLTNYTKFTLLFALIFLFIGIIISKKINHSFDD